MNGKAHWHVSIELRSDSGRSVRPGSETRARHHRAGSVRGGCGTLRQSRVTLTFRLIISCDMDHTEPEVQDGIQWNGIVNFPNEAEAVRSSAGKSVSLAVSLAYRDI